MEEILICVAIHIHNINECKTLYGILCVAPVPIWCYSEYNCSHLIHHNDGKGKVDFCDDDGEDNVDGDDDNDNHDWDVGGEMFMALFVIALGATYFLHSEYTQYISSYVSPVW